MAKLKGVILKDSIKWHKWMGWLGGLALLLFAISGMTHPLMSWTGPKAASFFPPQVKIKAENASTIPSILSKNNINEAIMVKIVPSVNGALLQVTESNSSPRRYFDIQNGNEIIDYDQAQAVWLARYYTGLKDATVKNIKFQTEFDSSYPWVNRLLPVYKIDFATDDNRSAFIYTELGALAGLTNDYKTFVQSIFKTIHTWSWLNDFEHGRVVLMMILLVSLFALSVTGTMMIFMMKNRKMELKRKVHRIISYAIWLPLLAFSASGTYHLLQYAYGDNHRGLKLGEPINVSSSRFGADNSWLDPYSQVNLNGLSIVEGKEGDLLYRLSLPMGRPGQKVKKQTRFDGMPIEKSALYFNAKTGNESDITDKDMAVFYAGKQLGLEENKITNTKLITHFGPNYDFRNKRLPVWRIDYDSDLGDKLFIDPATGMLVDRLVNSNRYEGYSFSFLHKWNFMTPLTGRKVRDVLIVVVLSFAVIATILGYMMLFRGKKRKLK